MVAQSSLVDPRQPESPRVGEGEPPLPVDETDRIVHLVQGAPQQPGHRPLLLAVPHQRGDVVEGAVDADDGTLLVPLGLTDEVDVHPAS